MKPTLRLAYLFSQYPAINHTYLFGEVAHLRKQGVEVHVASVLPPDRPFAELTPEEQGEAGGVFYLRSSGLFRIAAAHLATLFSRPRAYIQALLSAARMGGRHLFYFGEAVMLGRWMLAQGLCHVHIHYASAVGLTLPRIFPVSVSNSFHGPAEFQDPEGFRLAEKTSASLFVRAISKYGRSQIMRVSGQEEWDKIEVVRLGVNPEAFHPAPFRESPCPCEMICVGRLSPEKGQHVLVAAMGRLIGEGYDVRLRLVGDGPGRAELERHVSAAGLDAHVVFEGWAAGERVRDLYAQSDICALASFQEGIPVVLMEAMAMGLPVVATRITGIPELIRDGEEGLLVTPSDEEELACAIRALIRDPKLRWRLGEAGRRRVLREYDFRRNAAALAAVFRQRLGGGGESRA